MKLALEAQQDEAAEKEQSTCVEVTLQEMLQERLVERLASIRQLEKVAKRSRSMLKMPPKSLFERGKWCVV